MIAETLAEKGVGVKSIPLDQMPDYVARSETKKHPPTKKLAISWGDFEREEFVEGEQIAFGVERGEIAMLLSLPNAGKTTLTLNAALNLCLGCRFVPIAEGGKAYRVLYIDGEARRARLQRDIRRMTYDFDRPSREQLCEQLTLICEAEIAGESLCLTNPAHMIQITAEAVSIKPDLIVIDTMASLCTVFNENDNAEQQRRVWRPLQKLAREADAAILVIHHVGKRSEDSTTPESVYRGRGASASGAFARSVWILKPDPVTPGLVTLSCVKVKGEPIPDQRFLLDQKKRWFRTTDAPTKPKTSLELVVEAVTSPMSTQKITEALKGHLSERTVKEILKEAVQVGYLEQSKRGVYCPKSAESAESASIQNALSALLPNNDDQHSADSADDIGGALPALLDKE